MIDAVCDLATGIASVFTTFLMIGRMFPFNPGTIPRRYEPGRPTQCRRARHLRLDRDTSTARQPPYTRRRRSPAYPRRRPRRTANARGQAEAVACLKDAFGMSERRACKAIGCCRRTVRYETGIPGDLPPT